MTDCTEYCYTAVAMGDEGVSASWKPDFLELRAFLCPEPLLLSD